MHCFNALTKLHNLNNDKTINFVHRSLTEMEKVNSEIKIIDFCVGYFFKLLFIEYFSYILSV